MLIQLFESLSYAGVTPRSISKLQDGLEWSMHWSKQDCKSRYSGWLAYAKSMRFRNRIGGLSGWVRWHNPSRLQRDHTKARSSDTWWVDPAAIDWKIFVLPREISEFIDWSNREVSRGHSTHSNEFGLLRAYPIGLTNGEGLNVNWLQIMYGISSDVDSHH